VENALEQSCNALLALESSLASVVAIEGQHADKESSLRSAIDSVRTVVRGLRELLPGDQAPLGYGFVSRGKRHEL
jgi:hypothetical protein